LSATRFINALNSGVTASFAATALPAIWCTCGPPCSPGNTPMSIFLASSWCVDKRHAPRGPQNDLCVVNETTCAWAIGDRITPAETSPAVCAMSASSTAPTSSAILRNSAQSTSQGNAEYPPMSSFGFASSASLRIAA
jgi:hypothetical protein